MKFADISPGADNYGFAKLLLIKRTEFEHENEVRILFCDGTYQTLGDRNIVKFELNPCCIFDEVVLDPRLEQSVFEEIKTELTNLGWKKDIKQSKLYYVPEFKIGLE